jgi:3-oxoacyl-[acyl-carrier protein] reductase
MDLGLRGTGVVITGASRGIGRAIALGFAAEGANVAICARGDEALQQTRSDLLALGGEVLAEVCDVGEPAALTRFIDSAEKSFGSLGILVCNASAFGLEERDEAWSAGFEVDVMASVRATRHVVPALERSGGGSIVLISSTAALEAPGSAPYSAMKAALISYSKNMAVQLAAKQIRVNCVAPGSIEFPGGIWERTQRDNPELYESILATIPLGRLGTPEEVADVVVFVASKRANWITGATLSVDGSQHKGNL